MNELIRITPNKEKASSMIRMVEITLNRIKDTDLNKYPSNITKDYYDTIRELIGIVLLLDGYKLYGEGAHKRQIDYLKDNYKLFKEYEINLIDELREKRNKISYDGFFVDREYVSDRINYIGKIISKLKDIIKSKL